MYVLLRICNRSVTCCLIDSHLVIPLLYRFKFSRNRSDNHNELFQLLDDRGKGFIEASDLMKVSKEMGKELTASQAEQLALACSPDGRLDAAQFRARISR